MKKFCKIVLFVLCLSLLCGSFAGCNSKRKRTEKTITILYSGFVNGAVPKNIEDDPYKKLIDETYDVDWQLSLTSDLDNEILKRYSSSRGDKPDVIIFQDYNKLKALYDQGFFVQDYTPYLQYMPNIAPFYNEHSDQVASLYEDEKLTCLAYINYGTDWGYKIRKDWVREWNTVKGTQGNPKTADELLDMARWVKSSKGSDHYLFTSAGENKGLGYIKNLLYMFNEYDTWYVNENQELSHPVLDGTHKQFMDYLKIIVDEGLIDPDWYTQSWGNHKTKLYGGKIGIDWYTPVLPVEYMEGSTKVEATGADIWDNLEMPTSTPGVTRQGASFTRIGHKIAISKTNASDPERMKKICTILNDMMWQPTDDIESSLYYQLRWGVNIDNYTLKGSEAAAGKATCELERVLDAQGNDTGFYAYYVQANRSNHKRATYGSLWDYGAPVQSLNDKVIEYGGVTSYGQSAYDYIRLYNETQAYYAKQTKLNYGDMISLSPKVVTNAKATYDMFEIQYVKGNVSNYDSFKNSWLKNGAQSLRDSAEKQLKALGYIK